jgi:hypothetical protein
MKRPFGRICQVAITPVFSQANSQTGLIKRLDAKYLLHLKTAYITFYIKYKGFIYLRLKKKILHIIPSHRLFEFAYKGLFGFGLVVLKLCGLKKLIILKCGQ